MKFKQEQVGFKPVTITLETMDECLWLKDVLDNGETYEGGKEKFLNKLHLKLEQTER